MGCCLLTLLGMITPRVVIIVLWLFTDWLGRAYETTLWPVLGFLFMPYTTLAYAAAMVYNQGLSGPWMALFIIGIIVDVGNWGGGKHSWNHCR